MRRGSDGVEVRAHQISLDRPVVLKILDEKLSRNASYATMFVKRAREISRLNHPNLIPLYFVAKEYGLYFAVREDVEMQNLRDVLAKEGRLDVASALPMFQQIADGLEYAWRQSKLTHGNIKPAYIAISDYGMAKLADVGLAQIDLGDEPEKIKGTPQYISPEQILGEETDLRSDIYSLGCNLYQCLTGHYPFVSENTIEIFQKHLGSEIYPPNQYDPTIPGTVCMIIAKMMAKKKEDRYPDGSTLLQDLLLVSQGGEPNYAVKYPPPANLMPGIFDDGSNAGPPMARLAEEEEEYEEEEYDEQPEYEEEVETVTVGEEEPRPQATKSPKSLKLVAPARKQLTKPNLTRRPKR